MVLCIATGYTVNGKWDMSLPASSCIRQAKGRGWQVEIDGLNNRRLSLKDIHYYAEAGNHKDVCLIVGPNAWYGGETVPRLTGSWSGKDMLKGKRVGEVLASLVHCRYGTHLWLSHGGRGRQVMPFDVQTSGKHANMVCPLLGQWQPSPLGEGIGWFQERQWSLEELAGTACRFGSCRYMDRQEAYDLGLAEYCPGLFDRTQTEVVEIGRVKEVNGRRLSLWQRRPMWDSWDPFNDRDVEGAVSWQVNPKHVRVPVEMPDGEIRIQDAPLKLTKLRDGNHGVLVPMTGVPFRCARTDWLADGHYYVMSEGRLKVCVAGSYRQMLRQYLDAVKGWPGQRKPRGWTEEYAAEKEREAASEVIGLWGEPDVIGQADRMPTATTRMVWDDHAKVCVEVWESTLCQEPVPRHWVDLSAYLEPRGGFRQEEEGLRPEGVRVKPWVEENRGEEDEVTGEDLESEFCPSIVAWQDDLRPAR
jgi:hypothetical protein